MDFTNIHTCGLARTFYDINWLVMPAFSGGWTQVFSGTQVPNHDAYQLKSSPHFTTLLVVLWSHSWTEEHREGVWSMTVHVACICEVWPMLVSTIQAGLFLRCDSLHFLKLKLVCCSLIVMIFNTVSITATLHNTPRHSVVNLCKLTLATFSSYFSIRWKRLGQRWGLANWYWIVTISYKYVRFFFTRPVVGIRHWKCIFWNMRRCANKLSLTFDQSSNQGANHSVALLARYDMKLSHLDDV